MQGGAYANAVTLTAIPEASTFFVIGLNVRRAPRIEIAVAHRRLEGRRL